jgi:tripartite-type tricarboxylate transporter receptor subunit TctC
MKLLIGSLLCAMCAAGAHSAWAQNYPVKPVRMVVGFAAGSTTDLIGRVIAQKMSEGLGQSVIMENRPGAGSNVAYEVVSKVAPDGYTVLIANAGIATGATAYVKLNFNALRDFAPVSQVSSTPHILVIHPSLPVKSVKELTAFAKARPGQLNFASTGHGNSDHMAAALYHFMTGGLDMVHITYKGGPQAAGDVLTGQIALYFSGMPVGLPLAKAGKLRALAVTTAKRSNAAPDVPTMAEAGVTGYEHSLWAMLMVPAATTKEVIARLHREAARAVESADVRERLAGMGVDTVGTTPEQAGAYLRSEIDKYAKVVKAIGLRIE